MITITFNPETHKLVPVEPTPEMRAAALSQFTLPRIWDAMLAAAPQQEEREECDCPAEKMPFGRCCKSQASLGQAWHGAAQWLRNNYQDHRNITSLCEAMVGAAPQGDKVAPWNWRMVLPGGLKTDKWDSARVGDYNNGWNAYRTKAVVALESLEAHQPPPAKADHWQQYAKPGETAQQCIERHRAEQDALMTLLAQDRAEQAAKAVREAGAAPAVPQDWREQLKEAIAAMRKAAYEFGLTDNQDDHDRMMEGQRRVFEIADGLASSKAASPHGYALVPDWKGYARFGTGNYVLNHTSGPMDPELGAEIIVTLATDADRSGNRKVGESRDTDPNAPPIQPENMVIRMGFLSPEAINALEEQLIHLRRENFPDTQPLAAAPKAQAEGGEVGRDTARLDWLTFNLSGASLRAIGVIWSEHGDARRAIDAAMSASAAKTEGGEHG